jgi:hypothetical protein
VLASDSQTSFGDDSKRLDAQKIRVVEFGKDKILVAQSGSVETSSRIIDVMADLAKSEQLESQETVIKITQLAIQKVREEQRTQHFNCTAEEFREIVWNLGLDCSLMVAHFHAYRPFIHTFSFVRGTTCTSKSFYESTGCGSALASYLLGELATPEMDTNFGKALAVYVVDKTIKNVDHCDRPIRLAIVFPWKPSHFPPPDPLTATVPGMESRIFVDSVDVPGTKEVKEIEEKVAKIDEDTRQQRIDKLRSALSSYADSLPKIPDYSNLKYDE